MFSNLTLTFGVNIIQRFLVSMTIVTFAVMLVCVCVSCRPACKHDISRREAWTDLIFGISVYHIEYKNPIVFGGGQRSFGVNGSKCINLVNTISQKWKLGQVSYLIYWCTTLSMKSLLFLVEVKGHLGSTGSKCVNLVNTISQERKLGKISYMLVGDIQ